MSDPSKTLYGEIHPDAPAELRAFSFLIGKWDGMTIREHYLAADADNFIYQLDVSTDAGRTWTKDQIVMTFRRAERGVGTP